MYLALPPPKTMNSAQEYLQKLLREVDVSRFCEEAYFLPFQIESLKLNNIGLFEKFEAHFRRNSVNVIYGPGGFGKSMVTRSILLAFGRRHRYFDDRALAGGRIELKIFSDRSSISLTADHGYITGYQCLLIDDLLRPIPTRIVPSLLKNLDQLGVQVITTARSPQLDKNMLQAHAHVIFLENHSH